MSVGRLVAVLAQGCLYALYAVYSIATAGTTLLYLL